MDLCVHLVRTWAGYEVCSLLGYESLHLALGLPIHGSPNGIPLSFFSMLVSVVVGESGGKTVSDVLIKPQSQVGTVNRGLEGVSFTSVPALLQTDCNVRWVTFLPLPQGWSFLFSSFSPSLGTLGFH